MKEKNSGPWIPDSYRTALAREQRVVVRNSLKLARQLRVKNETLYIQEIPKKEDFQVHMSSSSNMSDSTILKAVYPPQLHELVDSNPYRELDGVKLHKLICSAARLKQFISTSSKESVINDDLALECYRRLSLQRKLMKSTSSYITENVKVVATAAFDEEYTELSDNKYLYYYRIYIENNSLDSVQILGRQWTIASGNNLEDIQLVPAFAPGVIGLQPFIDPGDVFHYTSCSVIKSHHGSMEGKLLLLNLQTNQTFELAVAPFRLTPI